MSEINQKKTENLENLEKIKKIIGKKVKIQGKADPAYVLCQAGCSEYTPYLPDKASAVKDYIAKTFARFTTGDQSLHAEIDACATLNPRLERNIEQVVSPVNEVDTGDMDVDAQNRDVDISNLEQFAYKAQTDASATSNNLIQTVSAVNEVDAGDIEQTLNVFSSDERYLLYCLCQNSTYRFVPCKALRVVSV